MLPEWYFTCCVRGRGTDAATFLSILDLLETDDADSPLYAAALNELRRLSLPLRCYAVPKLLTTRRRIAECHADETARSLYAHWDSLEEGLAGQEGTESVAPLFVGLRMVNSDDRLVTALQSLLQQLHRIVLTDAREAPDNRGQNSVPPDGEMQPYSRIHTHMAPALAMFVVADLQNAGHPVDLESVRTALEPVVKAALRRRWGRFAYLAAVEAAGALEMMPRHKLCSQMLQTWGDLVLYEPNLTWAYQRLIYPRDISNSEDLQQEMHQLERFNQLMNRLAPWRRWQAGNPVLDGLGFPETGPLHDSLLRTWPAIVWQTGLWYCLAAVDPHRASKTFLEQWKPDGDPAEFLAFAWNNEPKKQLVGLRRYQVTGLRPQRSPDTTEATEPYHWAYTSPWVQWVGRDRAHGYPAAEHPATAVRLAGASILAARLLRRFGQSSRNEPGRGVQRPEDAFLWLFLLHAYHIHGLAYQRLVSNIMRGWEDEVTKGEGAEDEREDRLASQSLPVALGTILAAMAAAVQHLGCGRVDVVSPQDVLEPLGPEFDAWNENVELRRFRFYHVHTALIRLLYQAYPGAVSEHEGPGRWLPLVPRLFEGILEAWSASPTQGVEFQLNPYDLQLAALLYKFLCRARSDDPLLQKVAQVEKKLDPSRYLSRGWQQQWLTHYRVLLLHEAPLASWWPEGWLEPDWDNPTWPASAYPTTKYLRERSPQAAARLVRALQRFSAWRVATEEDRAAVAKRCGKDPQKEFWELLCAMQDQNLDRLIVLRMHEMLHWPETHSAREGLIALVAQFLQSPRAFDIARFLENVEALAQHTIAESLAHRAEYVRVFDSVASILHTAYVQSRNKLNAPTEASRPARPPHHVVHERARADLLADSWLRLAGIACSVNHHELKRALASVVSHHLRDESTQRLVVEWRELEIRRARTNYCGEEIPEAAIHGAILDNETGRIALPWRPNRQILIPPKDGEIRCIVLTETPNRYFCSSRNIPQTAARTFTAELDRNPIAVPLDVWDPDISRSFDANIERRAFVLARFDDRVGTWEPVERGLIELVAATFLDDASRVTLVFVDEQEGDASWRFSRLPGELYRLPFDAFVPKTVNDLQAEIDHWTTRGRSASGLLVTFVPVPSREGIKLELSGIGVAPNEPESPFDARNLVWRELFRSEVIPLVREAGEWLVDVREWLDEARELANDEVAMHPEALLQTYNHPEVLGFPVRFSVPIPEGYAPQETTSHALVEAKAANTPRNLDGFKLSFVRNDFIAPRALPDDKARAEFVHTWTRDNLVGVECTVYSRGEVRTDGRGNVFARTPESIGVRLDLTTVALEPVEEDELGKRFHGRHAVITGSNRQLKRHSLDLDPACTQKLPWNGHAELVGIVHQAPNYNAARKMVEAECQVWIANATGVQSCQLQINNYSDLRNERVAPEIGARVTIRRDNTGAVQAMIDVPVLYARLTWGWAEQGTPAVYLGQDHHGRAIALAHEPGKIVQLPTTADAPLVFARWHNGEWRGGLPKGERLHWSVQRDRYGVLKWRTRHFYVQIQAAGEAKTQVTLADLRWGVEFRRSGQSEYLLLTPQATVESAARYTPVRIPEVTYLDPAEWLSRYAAAPHDLKAQARKPSSGDEWTVQLLPEDGGQPIQIPVPGQPGAWTSEAVIPEGHGTFLTGTIVGQHALQRPMVRLCQSDNGDWFPSFRATTPLDLKGYLRHCGFEGRHERLGDTRLNVPLCYAGPATDDPSRHRFELGPGRLLEVPEKDIMVEGAEFGKVRYIYIGDRVTRASVTCTNVPAETAPEQAEPEEATQPEEPHYILELRAIESPASEIASEADNHKLVHFVEVRLDKAKDKVVVVAVRGINSNILSERELERSRRPERIELNEASQFRMRNRLAARLEASPAAGNAEREGLGREDALIAARLTDVSPDGTLILGQVRCSFETATAPDAPPAFPSGHRIVLTVLKTGATRNDLFLELAPPPTLDVEDLGRDFESILMLRRDFSVSEARLGELISDEARDRLEGDRFVATLVKQSGRDKPHASLLEPPLVRPAEALASAIDSAPAGSVLGYYLGRREKPCVRARMRTSEPTHSEEEDQPPQIDIYEIYPGIFAGIPAEPGETATEKGALVRLSKQSAAEGTVYRREIAMFGQGRYIPDSGRPVIVFPKDRLTRRPEHTDPRTWRRAFSIGDFPNLEPGCHPALAATEKDADVQMLHLMQRRHPKIALVRPFEYKGGRVYGICSCNPGGRIGRLKLDGPEPAKMPFDPNDASPNGAPVTWARLSYRDAGHRQIQRAIKSAKWWYHERETFHWDQDNRGEAAKYDVEPGGGSDGPYDFESDGPNGWGLRYQARHLRERGLPFAAFRAAAVAARNRRVEVVVVCYDAHERTVWVEISPGRLVELPVARFEYAAGHRRYPLDEFAWELLAPGDRLHLELMQAGTYEIERVTLRSWAVGPRGAFTRRNVFLPRTREGEKDDGLRLGSGQFKLTYPVSSSSTLSDGPFCLDAGNRLVDLGAPEANAASYEPAQGDTVFLCLDDQGALKVGGFPKLRPQPERDKSCWSDLGILPPDLTPSERVTRLRQLIEAVGNALPVNVTFIRQHEGWLAFSLENLRVPARRLMLGSPCGCLSGDNLVLRSGGALDVRPVTDLVDGLSAFPSRIQSAVATYLLESGARVWWGGSRSGLPGDDGATFGARVIEVIDDSAGKEHLWGAGLIAKSLATERLIWIPASRATFADLTRQEFLGLFRALLAQPEGLVVQVQQEFDKGKPSYSLVRTPRVRAEYESARVGQELMARVVWQYPSQEGRTAAFVVQCVVCDVLMTLVWNSKREAPKRGDELPLEIARRTHGYPFEIVTYLHGYRPVPLDLPENMLEPAEERPFPSPDHRLDSADAVPAKWVLELLWRAYDNGQLDELERLWILARRRALRSKHVEAIGCIGWGASSIEAPSSRETRRVELFKGLIEAVRTGKGSSRFVKSRLEAFAQYLHLHCISQQNASHGEAISDPEDIKWTIYADALHVACGSYSNQGRLFDYANGPGLSNTVRECTKEILPITSFLTARQHPPLQDEDHWADQLKSLATTCSDDLWLLPPLPAGGKD